jgi:amino acid adenylation domain-containing protein
MNAPADSSNDIAIIGMAGRFPGAPDIDAFWRNLRDGVESIRRFDPAECDALGVDPAVSRHPHFVPAGAPIAGHDGFDHAFWGYAPREAALMDPQQRLFLECCWSAVEHAGYDPRRVPGLTGVYAGTGLSTYLLFNLSGNPDVGPDEEQLAMLGNDKDFLCTRVSYHLNLHGPSVTVQTGCSTSLVAAHLAVDGLLSYQCDTALVGGVNLVLPQRTGYVHHPGSTASSDGHCRAFDAAGDGAVFGSGVGVIVLKRLADAVEHGDTIYALIKGSAVNNDGARRVGFTAPGVEGQAEVIVRAQRVAGVAPRDVGYIETHGTGTQYGDPVEVAALTRAFRNGTGDAGFCALGSVKTNIGHLDAAAGVVSIIKATLALHHGVIPPSLHFDTPNPEIDFASSPFYVNTTPRPWPEGTSPRRAGVSGFGFGGTNAHLILEQAPRLEDDRAGSGPALIVLSARTEAALDKATGDLLEHLRSGPATSLAPLADTLLHGRSRFEYRRSLVVADAADAVKVLSERPAQRVRDHRNAATGRGVLYMIPGLGDQYPKMGADLYRNEPVYRAVVDECSEILRPTLGSDLRAALYPATDHEPRRAGAIDLRAMLQGASALSGLRHTALGHPALFVTEYALARLWMSMGVMPGAMIGHSLGEYVAATLAGVFDLPDALTFVARRAQLIGSLPRGAMLAVPESAADLAGEMTPDVSIALVNGPKLTVVAGTDDAIAALQTRLTARAVTTRRLQVDHAFHSPMLDPLMEPLTRLAAGMPLSAPAIPFVSNITGDWIRHEEAVDPAYWGGHSARVVQFAAGLATAMSGEELVPLEVGPGHSLSTLAAEYATAVGREPSAVPSMRAGYDNRQSDRAVLLDARGQLWALGVDAAQPRPMRRVALPTYPFERQRAWIDPPAAHTAPAPVQRRSTTTGDWLWAPEWRSLPTPQPSVDGAGPEHWLILDGSGRDAAALIARAAGPARRLSIVEYGTGFQVDGPDRYRIAPAVDADYRSLFRHLAASGDAPTTVMMVGGAHDAKRCDGPNAADDLLTLTYLTRTLSTYLTHAVDVWVVTHGLADIDTGDESCPSASMVLAAAMCAQQEFENVTVRCVDVPAAMDDRTARRLVDLTAARPAERLIAHRGRRLWIRQFEPMAVEPPVVPLPPSGVHLVVGGLGTIGLDLVEHLSEADAGGHFVLTSRGPFPEPFEWDAWLSAHDDETSRRIRRIRAIERNGAEVVVRQADVTDAVRMRAVLDEVYARYGRLDGVVHAAGIAGQRSFQMMNDATVETVADVIRAKVTGTSVLAGLLRERPAGYVLLLSSNVSILGGIGAVAYAAGNLFLNAFAQREAAATDQRWLSVSIEEWLTHGESMPALSFTQYGLSPSDGVRVLRRAIEGAPVGWTAVVTGDLEQRRDQWVRDPAASRRGRVQRSARPDLPVPYAEPRGDVERAIAGFWRDLLGIEPIGRDDNFYELGGHSLLATQIIARVRAELGTELTLLSLLNAPTVAGFAAAVGRAGTATDYSYHYPSVSPEVPDGDMGLSYGQRRFWFFDQLAPGNTMYNLADTVRMDGPLHVDDLRLSIEEIIARHASLRTSFGVVDGDPVAVVHSDVPFDLPLIDLSSDPSAEATWPEYARRAAEEAFDLTVAPLIRVCVLRLDAFRHILLSTTHHSASDAWSTGVFIRELAAGYARRRGLPVEPVAAPRVQYPAYAAWQRELLTGERRERLSDFWRAALPDAPPHTGFPADRMRPTEQSYRGASLPINLPQTLVQRLGRIARDRECTLFMTLLAAFNCLLYRYTGDRDLVVGSPIAGRVRPEFEDMIGVFVNMLPLRVVLEAGDTFADVLARVRETTLNAFAHQDLPFELIVDELRAMRTLSHNPVFQTAFALQTAPLPPLELAGLTLRVVPTPTVTAKFDLLLMLRETESGAVGHIEYATDLYDAETIERIVEHFLTLLESVCEDPESPIGRLPLEATAERADTADVGPTCVDIPADSVVELFAARARAHRDEPAVRLAGSATGLTFGELDDSSDRMAHALRSRGIGAGCRVGVCLERGPATVALLLGIMKAGAAYVPLDPAYPFSRLEFMAVDAGLDLLVGGDDDRYPHVAGVPTASLDSLAQAGLEAPEGPVDHRVRPNDAAYVLYTSGSTGVPKGTIGWHGGMVNRIAWMWRRYPFGREEVVCQRTSLSFLDSFWEMFGPLCHGVPIVIISQQTLLEPADLVKVLEDEGVTRIVLIPSLLGLLLDAVPDTGQRLPRLRHWTCSGETLPRNVVERFCTALPDRTLLNLYGSSEISADVTYHEVSPADLVGRAVPIGRPIDNTVIRILDEDMVTVPVGVVGDLYAGGAGTGGGYLGRPGLTADRFVPDPYSAAQGAVLFRTGDRARYRADGVIEYVGRRDDQVKVRGFRVEVGEVEAALAEHPDVTRAAVTVEREALVALCATVPGTELEPAAVIEFVRHRLPGYMVPAAIVGCDELPLTPSGKLDRTAVRSLVAARTDCSREERVAPGNVVEHALAILFGEALGTAGEVAIHDNFFAVGGHSLAATRLVLRVREDFGVDLPLAAFLGAPTVSALADALATSADAPELLARRAELIVQVASMSSTEVDARLVALSGAEDRA